MNSPLLNDAVLGSYALLWLLVLGLGVLMIAMLRHLGLLFEAVDPVFRFNRSGTVLKLGDPLPSIRLERPGDGPVDPRRLAESDLFLLVVQPDCEPCRRVVEEAHAALLSGHSTGWRVVLVVVGDHAAAAQVRERYHLGEEPLILADPARGSVKEWGVTSTPFALVVGSDGSVQRKFPSVVAEQVRVALAGAPAAQRGPQRFHVQATPVPSTAGEPD